MQGLRGGTARGDADLGRRLSRMEKSIDLLDQRMQRQQRIPEAAPGGGIEGITRVSAWSLSTSATATNVLATPSGTFEITERAGTAPTVTQDGPGVTLAEGYYIVTMDYFIAYNPTVPAAGRVWLDYSGSEYHFPQQVSPIVDDVVGGSADLMGSWTVGPLPVVAPGSLTFGASWPGSNTSAFVNYWSLDIAKVGGA